MARHLLPPVLLLSALWPVNQPVFAQDRGQNTTFSADRFGYTIATGAACPRQWIDTAAGILLTPSAAPGAAADDGAASWPLAEPFEFYGRLEHDLMVSTNGYLAFAADASGDNGGDWRNGCPLPKVAENDATALGRVLVLHDDLKGEGGEMRAQFFARCPRPGELPAESCSVVEWHNWQTYDGSQSNLNFQAVLYHTSRAVVLQYADPLPDTITSTIGMQQQELQSAVNVTCNQSQTLPPSGAVCLYYPWPVEVLLRDGMEAILPPSTPGF